MYKPWANLTIPVMIMTARAKALANVKTIWILEANFTSTQLTHVKNTAKNKIKERKKMVNKKRRVDRFGEYSPLM